MPRRITDSRKAQVIELYRRGVALETITEETNVPRGTIYYLLDKVGITPNRQQVDREEHPARDELVATINRNITSPDAAVYAQMMVVIWELQREVGRLQGERDAARETAIAYRMALLSAMDELGEDLGRVPPVPAGWWGPDESQDGSREVPASTEERLRDDDTA